MNIVKKFQNWNNTKLRKNVVKGIAGLVAFSVTYSLILPAITIDEETAENEPGIVLNENENSEEVLAGYEAPEEVTAEVPEEEPAVVEEAPAEEVQEEAVEEPKEEAPEVVEETKEEAPVEEPVQVVAAEKLAYEAKDDYKFTVELESNSGLTEAAKLEIKEIVKEDEYANALQKAQKEFEDKIVKARFFEVKFLENEEVKNAAGKVTAVYAPVKAFELDDTQELTVVTLDRENRFSEIDEKKVDFKVNDKKTEEVKFETEELNEFAVIVTENIPEGYPAQDFEGKAGDVAVKVSAPEGAFPEGTTMSVAPVAEEKVIDQVSGAVEAKVGQVKAVDITFKDKDGNEIEPKKQIKVSMTSDLIKTAGASEIVHIDDEGKGSVVAQSDDKSADDEVIFESKDFSIYVIAETIESQIITADGETYKVTVTYDSNAGVPENAELEVAEITGDDSEYSGYVVKAVEAVSQGNEKPFVNAARLFSVKIMADGKEVTPTLPVEVKIEYVNPEALKETSNVEAVDVGSGTAKALEAEVQGNEEQLEGVTFTAKPSSIYAVIIIDNEEGTFVVEDDRYKVTISYTKEANIPIGTELTVKEITDIEEYDKLWNQAVEKMNEGIDLENCDPDEPKKGLTDAAFFDISLNYNGQEIEPDVPLGVKIEFKEGGVILPENEEAKIVHFSKDDVEIIDEVKTEAVEEDLPANIQDRELLGSFEYMQDSFSPVGAVTTGIYSESTVSEPPMRLLAANRAVSEIAATKTITDDDGDGVYELALSVTGSSETNHETNVSKSNIVIIIDRSGSMTQNYTYTPYTYSAATYSSSTEYWGVYNGNYYRVIRNNNNTGWRWQQNNTAYNGTVYTRETRMAATKTAAKALVSTLLSNNKPAGTVAEDGVTRLDDIIEISLISFAGSTTGNGPTSIDDATIHIQKSTNETTLNNTIDGLNATGGTNWEAALRQALTAANAYADQTDENTAIIFLTDGMPTFYLNNANSRPAGQGGTGSDNANNVQNVRNSWTYAKDDARALVAAGYTVYNIFAFGSPNAYDGNRTPADFMKALTNYEYGTTNTDYTYTTTTQWTRDYFFDASDTKALTDAFQKIINNITDTVGYGGVEYDDGVTLGVTNTSVAIDGQTHEDSFRYTVRDANNRIVYTVKIANGTATFDITGKGTHVDNQVEQVTTIIDPNDRSKDIVSDVYKVTVDDVDYMMSPAHIDPETGMIEWDLAGLGILENGYTYTLAFDVWPNQDSYDMVADLNNGIKTIDQCKAEVIAKKKAEGMTDAEANAYWQRIEDALIDNGNGQYAVKTNYSQTVDYYTVETSEDDQGHSTTTYTEQPTKEVPFEGDIALTSKPLPMVKVWNSSLSPDQIGTLLYNDYPDNTDPTKYRVTLHVWKADTGTELQNMLDQYSHDPATASQHDYIDKTLGWSETAQDYVWSDVLSIAPGTMVKLTTAQDMGMTIDPKKIVTYEGVQYYIIERGHYYYVTEDNIDWHFILETVVYHPMLVDGRLKNVTFIVDEEDNIIGVEDIEDMTQVTATNSKTAELDITKLIEDRTDLLTEEQLDRESFTYKISLTVPLDADMTHTNAFEWVPRLDGDIEADNRFYIYGYQSSEEPEVLGLPNDVARFNNKVYGRYTVSWPGGDQTLDEIFTDDGNGETMSGTIYVTLNRNEVIRLTNLPANTKYTIEEVYNNLYQNDPSRDADAKLDNPPASNIEDMGYTVQIATKNGSPTVTGRTVTGTISELNKRYYNQFTNILNNTVVLDLEVTKHLIGYEWTGERYYMLLTSDDDAPLPRTTTRYLSAASGSDDVSYNFGSIHLTEPGTYVYHVTETESDFQTSLAGKLVNGITYDDVKTITITTEMQNDRLVLVSVEGADVTYDQERNVVNAKVNNKVTYIDLLKIGEGIYDRTLDGVKFKLYSDPECQTEVTVDARGAEITEMTTADGGQAHIGTLNPGTYYLKETATLGGYVLPEGPIEITVADDGTVTYLQSDYTDSNKGPDLIYKDSEGNLVYFSKIKGDETDTYKDNENYTFVGYRIVVSNNTGEELPHTGGTGTLPYTLGGLTLIMIALVYGFVMRRRERRLND